MSVIDSLSPMIMFIARSWSPASSVSAIASMARPRSNSSSLSSSATAGLDGSQPERRRHRQLQTTGDLPAQRDAGEQRLLHEAATAQPFEQRWLQPRCASEQADDRLLARREQMQGVGGHGADDACRQ